MNKLFLILTLAILNLVTFSSCSKNDNASEVEQSANYPKGKTFVSELNFDVDKASIVETITFTTESTCELKIRTKTPDTDGETFGKGRYTYDREKKLITISVYTRTSQDFKTGRSATTNEVTVATYTVDEAKNTITSNNTINKTLVLKK